ncbi:uncharacterized protein C8A04DRAFT_13685 [Dichotomopilus funicola]|uniref:Uncharacterized protein n=1 Tax=Dichotomopilus funicola TaxID=1934379 RepID=A0AAN6V0Q1_9PEZI|nr:hypothetical protein C8A04DRAFT_13685 [Dichotomopilus funicola]
MAGTETAHTITHHAVRNGREYISYSDGTSHTRKLDRATGQPISDWAAVEVSVDETPSSTSEPPPTRYQTVIAEHQTQNEPKHWSLFSHIPNARGTGPGQVWQVTGDAEFMHFEHAEGVDWMESPDFAWHQVLSQDLDDAQLLRVDEIARAEKPPSAPNRAAVVEHCQGWTVRVVRRLVEEKIVKREGVVGMLEGYMDPIRN